MSEPSFLTFAEAGEHAGVSANGVRRWVAQGHLPSYRREGSRTLLVRADELEDFLIPRQVAPRDAS